MKYRELLQHIQYMDFHPRRPLHDLSNRELRRLGIIIQRLYDSREVFDDVWAYPGGGAPQRGWYRWQEFALSPTFQRTDPLSPEDVVLVREYVSILSPGRTIEELSDREVERIVIYLYNIKFFKGGEDYFEMAAWFYLATWGEYPWIGDAHPHHVFLDEPRIRRPEPILRRERVSGRERQR